MAHMMQKDSDSIACSGLNHVQIYAGRKGTVPPLRALRIVENVSDIPPDMLNDLRYALRQLLKNPGFTAVAVLTLALGIGLNAGIFTILNAVALRPLRVPGSERLVCVFQDFSRNRGSVPRNVYDDATRASYSEYREYRDNNHVFSGLVAYTPSVPA